MSHFAIRSVAFIGLLVLASACREKHGQAHEEQGAGEEEHGQAHEGHGSGEEGHGAGCGCGGEAGETAACEHEVPIAECDECRYEAGLVKVEPEVASGLLDAVEVRPLPVAGHRLKLRCEAGADRQATADVAATAEGRVERVVRALGQRVEAGDVLAVVQSQEAARSRMEHFRAHRELELARLELDRVSKVHDSLKTILAGPNVEAGGLPAGEQKAHLLTAFNDYELAVRLAAIERERVSEGNRLLGRDGAEAKAGLKGPYAGEWRRMLSEAREVRDLAHRDLERVEGLVRSGVRSSRELDAAKRDVAVADAAYRAAREVVGLEVDRLDVETESALRAARIRLEGASEEISLHLEAELVRARQTVDQAVAEEALAHRALLLMGIAEDALDKPLAPDSPELWRMEVKAPVAGTVVRVNAAPGGTVGRGETLMTLSDTESSWVWCDLYPEDLAALEGVGLPQPAQVETGGASGKTVQGSLDYIERTADRHTRTVKARIVVSGSSLRPGTFLSASLSLGGEGTGVVLPEEAVLSDGGERFVFVHLKGDLWARRVVSTEPAGDGLVRVVRGLEPGEQVAVKGAFFLKSDVLREKMGAGCAD